MPLVAPVLGVALAMVLSGHSGGQGVAHADAVVPDALLAELKAIDHKLSKLIREGSKTNSYPKDEVRDRVKEIAAAQESMLERNFTQTTFGGKVFQVVKALEVVDIAAENAREFRKDWLPAKKDDYDEFHFVRDMRDILLYGLIGGVDRLKKIFRESQEVVPQALQDALGSLEADLEHLRERDVILGTEKHRAAFIRGVEMLQKKKQRMFNIYYAQTVYSVRVSEVFRQLDCLEEKLHRAVVYATNSQPGDPDSRTVIRGFLKEGQKCKQKLEKEFRSAGSVTVTPTTSVGTPTIIGGD